MDRLIGQVIDGRYSIENVIGVGGMAVVYKAEDKLTGMEVAIKVLKDEFMNDEQFRRRFITESKAISMLSHKNIVKVFNVSFNSNIHYIVMEYIDGITLKQYIEQQGSLSWKETLYFTLQILDALQHAHQKGIVHRDIKPQNIMLVEDGTIKVADFGIARFTNADTFTMTDKAIGSVHYISPEQVSGTKPDIRSDIYSVGVMMFEMLTGTLPFDAVNPVSIAIMQLQNTPKRPTDINKNIPQGIEDIVLKAMAKKPDYRYQSAVEMMTDIEVFKQNPSIHFEYKYFSTDSSTKYIDVIKDVKETQNEEIDEMNDGRRNKNFISAISGIAVAFVLVTLLVLGAIFIIMPNLRSANDKSKEYKVPNLIGQNYNDVLSNEEEYGDFEFEEAERQYDDDVEAGLILFQEPKANSIITVEDGVSSPVIKITVSKGKESVLMEDYINTDYRDAENKLELKGFDVVIVKEYNEKIVLDNIIRTEPEANAVLEEGQTIQLVVSLGKEIKKLPMPDLIGKNEADARTAITENNLIVGNVKLVDSTAAGGTVVKQSTLSGDEVQEGTVIDLEISNAPILVTKTLTIPLPTAAENPSFIVTVKKGETEIYKKLHYNVDGSIALSVTGSGTVLYTVEIDGEFYDSYSVNFDE